MASKVVIVKKYTPTHSKEVCAYIRGILNTLELCQVIMNPDVKKSITAKAQWTLDTEYSRLRPVEQMSIKTFASLYGLKVNK